MFCFLKKWPTNLLKRCTVLPWKNVTLANSLFFMPCLEIAAFKSYFSFLDDNHFAAYPSSFTLYIKLSCVMRIKLKSCGVTSKNSRKVFLTKNEG
mmetsp:Transcript_19/g.44  ORF Transcript_19/g.44 Transcript_19/m.44 type:complete len:95 (+) Transcript_19:119-403(+)